MKITIILTILTVAATAQKQYPQCIATDCLDFLAIGVNCGYDGTSSTFTDAQKTCICNASGILTAYQQCAGCMALDPQSTVTYDTWPTACSLNTASSSGVSLKSISLAASSRSAAPSVDTVRVTVAPSGSSVVVVVRTSTMTVTTPSSSQSTSRTSAGQSASGSVGVASVSQTGTTSTPTSGSAQSGTLSAPSPPIPSLLLGMGDCGKVDCGPGTGNSSTYGNARGGGVSSDGVRGVVYGCYVLGGLVVVGLGWL